MSTLAAPGTTPSLEEVRDKIEQRYSLALGRADLAQNSVEGRRLEVQKATLDIRGSTRLEEIRASMAKEVGGAASPSEVTGAGARGEIDAANEPATKPADVRPSE
jgi:phage shock protein A